MGFFSDIQEEARREARQSRYQTGQTEDAAPVQNIQSKEERKPETTPPASVPAHETESLAPVPVGKESKQPAPAVTPMDDGEVMAASVKRIRADIERITRRNMKDCVAKHLADLCAKDPAFARTVMQPAKTMVNCFRYINRKAREYAEQERMDNGITENGVYGCDVPDDLCYQWAVDYFNDPNAAEDAKPQKKQKPQQKAAPANPVKAKPAAPAKGKASHSTCGEGCEQMSLLEAMA